MRTSTQTKRLEERGELDPLPVSRFGLPHRLRVLFVDLEALGGAVGAQGRGEGRAGRLHNVRTRDGFSIAEERAANVSAEISEIRGHLRGHKEARGDDLLEGRNRGVI